MADINVKLSISGLKDLQQYLKDYEKSLESKVDLFVKELATIGVDYAKYNVSDLNAVFTAELLDSIHLKSGEKTKGKSVYFVVADSNHAVFVEMGTGVVGANSQYTGPLPAVYAQGEKMFTNKDGKYGWVYYNEEIGHPVFTEGMPSRPFMWNTSQQMQEEVVNIAREIFKEK